MDDVTYLDHQVACDPYEHYLVAEQLVAEAVKTCRSGANQRAADFLLAQAQVHATLATVQIVKAG